MEASITVLIHGTLSASNRWYQPGSRFHRYLLSHGFADVYSGSDVFRWRAVPTSAARRQGADRLIKVVSPASGPTVSVPRPSSRRKRRQSRHAAGLSRDLYLDPFGTAGDRRILA